MEKRQSLYKDFEEATKVPERTTPLVNRESIHIELPSSRRARWLWRTWGKKAAVVRTAAMYPSTRVTAVNYA